MSQKTDNLLKVLLICFLVKYVVSRRDSYSSKESCPAIESEPWSYEGSSNGPSEWGESYPMCNGRKQSPINIDSRHTRKDSRLEELSLVNYNIPITSANVVNNGHSVETTPQDNVKRYIVIGGTTYYLQQFHFHWSKTRGAGTEHAFNNQRFNMEGHFVHSSNSNKTAVVGVLYKTSHRRNSALQKIVDILPKVRYQGDETVLGGNLNLNDLLPSNPSSFYRYEGSLTTPPCTEGVTWSVLKDVYHIGKDQLDQFFKLYAVPKDKAEPGCKITTNVRPLQPVNHRTIKSSQ